LRVVGVGRKRYRLRRREIIGLKGIGGSRQRRRRREVRRRATGSTGRILGLSEKRRQHQKQNDPRFFHRYNLL
jgi:hypothetical protein